MIKFNSNNIITGYIKQLLHSFNLPNATVYKEGMKVFNDKYYIKDNKIELFKDGNWIPKGEYHFGGKTLPNLSKTLKIDNLIYDTYTHEYLGEYLRFVRDYKNIDLMPLYNCFSNRIINNFNFGLEVSTLSSKVYVDNNKMDEVVVNVDENDESAGRDFINVDVTTNVLSLKNLNTNAYKIYALPVKFGKKYTIAIDSDFPVMCICGFYDSASYKVLKDVTDQDGTQIYTDTFKLINNISFTSPVVYDNLENIEVSESYSKNEKNLKLFIRLPYNNKSSITVLEGDYKNSVSKVIKKVGDTGSFITYPRTIINAEHENELDDLKLLSRHQLLALNSEISYPFADRLIEYLVDNVIASDETIDDNIIRLQEKLYSKGLQRYGNTKGEWNNKYKLYLYDIISKNEQLFNSTTDILGYVDKDVEHALGTDINIYNRIGELSDKELD